MFLCISLCCLSTIVSIRYDNCDNGNNSLVFVYENNVWEYDVPQSDNWVIKSDYNKRNELLAKRGVKKFFDNYKALGLSCEQVVEYIYPNIGLFIKDIVHQVNKEVVEASISFRPESEKMFDFCEGDCGIEVDIESVYKSISCGNEVIIIPTITISPKFSVDDLNQSICLRSCESTSYSGSESGRRKNLIRAINSFNGKIVYPNEVVSFNKTIGRITRENGYTEAMIILNGEFVKGLGGGVCQASTTVYNAALMAGIEIIQANQHSLPVHYVERGFDAMVNENGADVVFRNNTCMPIYIKTYQKDERVYVSIYGETMNGVEYKKVTETIEEIPPGEPKIIKDINGEYVDKVKYKKEYWTKKYAQNGYKVKTYIDEYKNGKFFNRKFVRSSTYLPQQAIIYEGIRDKEVIT